MDQINEVSERLKMIFCKRFDIHPAYWSVERQRSHFLSKVIGFSPRDLIYVFHDVEEKFSISIPYRSVISGEFSNFESLVNIICNQVTR